MIDIPCTLPLELLSIKDISCDQSQIKKADGGKNPSSELSAYTQLFRSLFSIKLSSFNDGVHLVRGSVVSSASEW